MILLSYFLIFLSAAETKYRNKKLENIIIITTIIGTIGFILLIYLTVLCFSEKEEEQNIQQNLLVTVNN